MKEIFDRAFSDAWNQTLKFIGLFAIIASISHSQSFISWAWVVALGNLICLLNIKYFSYKKENKLNKK